jgi:D-alanyl-D-alanine carboxypeptidase (penicillin-binding protein 5/6)
MPRASRLSFLALAVTLLHGGLPASARAAKVPAPPKVTAASVYVVDAETGQPLYEKSADTSFRILSLTKLITAFVVVQQAGAALSDRVTILPTYLVPGSSAGLRKGDIWTMRDLLYGMLLVSGNDAALALADHVGNALLAKEKRKGSGIARFVKEMGPAAKALGAQHSRFADPYGISAANVSTARDLGTIGRNVFRDKRLLLYWRCAVRTLEIGGPNARSIRLKSTIEMLGEENIVAAKTGSYFSKNIYHLMVGWRAPNGHSVVAVLLGATSHDARYNDMRTILAALPRDYPELAAAAGSVSPLPANAGCD